MSEVDIPSEELTIKRSISLSKELDGRIKDLEQSTGENYSAVVRMLLKLGLSAQEEGLDSGQHGKSSIIFVKSPHSDWILATASVLQIPPEALLRRLVVDGLKKYLDEANTYREARLQIEASLGHDEHAEFQDH